MTVYSDLPLRVLLTRSLLDQGNSLTAAFTASDANFTQFSSALTDILTALTELTAAVVALDTGGTVQPNTNNSTNSINAASTKLDAAAALDAYLTPH